MCTTKLAKRADRWVSRVWSRSKLIARLAASGDYDQAIIYFQLELHEAQRADLPDDILYCHRFLGECYLHKNEFRSSEQYHLNFLSLAQEYGNNERLEQAYTCLANAYWLWLSYLQDDILYDAEHDQLPRDLCKRSLGAAQQSLAVIDKLDVQLEDEMKGKRLVKAKDIEEKQQDLALRRVRSYINIGACENELREKQYRSFSDLSSECIKWNLHQRRERWWNAQSVQSIYQTSSWTGKVSPMGSLYIHEQRWSTFDYRKHHLYQELARLHSSLSCFYLSVPNYLQYKKEILATMEQAIHYARLTKSAHDYLSCLYDIAQVRSTDKYSAVAVTRGWD